MGKRLHSLEKLMRHPILSLGKLFLSYNRRSIQNSSKRAMIYLLSIHCISQRHCVVSTSLLPIWMKDSLSSNPNQVKLLSLLSYWLTYDFPPEVREKLRHQLGSDWKGQAQSGKQSYSLFTVNDDCIQNN